MEWYIIGAMVVIAVSMIVYGLMPKDENPVDVVRRRSAGLTKDQDASAIEAKARQRASHKPNVLEWAAPLLSRPMMPKNLEQASTLRAKLVTGGFRKESAPAIFLASKTLGAFACGGVAALLAFHSGKDMLHMAGQVVFGFAIGFLLPNLWLSMTIKKRSEHIRNGLPDSLDLMVVAVESGLGLDAAIQRVSDEMNTVHPALAEEMQIAIIETQMGVLRAEALSKMADRTAVLEMRSLVATIVQAEKLGTSIAKALRTQADTLRTKRRQAAEERAQKTAVKLLLPLILFIFPTIFIVLAGPAAIQLMETFKEGGGISK